jgi:diguanylate cyclase (GGDEF)-like protein
MRRIGRWWRQPDHFDWLSGYLQARDLSRPTRILMAALSATLTLAPVNILWGPPPIDRTVAVAVCVLAGIGGLSWAAMWLTRWPTGGQSVACALTGTVVIGLGCANHPIPLIGLLSCSALAITGGYLAFFHTTPFMATNFAVAAVVAVTQCVRLATSGEVIPAISLLLLVIELNIAVPLAIQIVVRALGIDLLQSDRDPLTGLLNRRSFQHTVVGVLLARRDADSFLALAMIDLDQFKAINDTRGHAVGDATLAAVGRALRETTTDTAVVGRMGGEEFLVAEIVTTSVPHGFGERLCAAVGTVSLPVTASVGTATVALSSYTAEDAAEVFDRLVAEADAAMYRAKRGGGDQVHHFGTG